MTKKTVGIVLAVLAVMLLCPLTGLLFVGYDKMMVHNMGSAAEEQGIAALVGGGCCCSIIMLLGIAAVVLMVSKPKEPNG